MNSTASAPTQYKPGCNPITQLARQRRIDALYEQDGRHLSNHPLRGRYTGLWAQYVGEPCTDELSAA